MHDTNTFQSFRGRALGDLTGPTKTSGQARYVGDLAMEGLLEGGVIRSPHAHADILSIDVSRALAVPGVCAAVTSADFPDAVYPGLGGALADRPAMARGRVLFVGEEVVALAATSREALDKALPLVQVRYRPRPAIFTTEMALSPHAPRLHPATAPDNVIRRHRNTRGVAPEPTGMVSVSARYGTGSQAHCCLEPHTVIAAWLDESGPIDLWAPSQGPQKVREDLATLFQIDLGRIRTHDVAIGGDFGSRVKVLTSEAIAMALSRKARRPVRISLSRAEEFAATKRRMPFDVDIRITADLSGRIRSMEAVGTSNMGAYHFAGAGDFGYFPAALTSLYAAEHASVRIDGVYTNLHPLGAFRGAGAPQAGFIRESCVDELARALDIDPLDFRLRNLHGDEEKASGWRLDSARLRVCLERAAELIGWRDGARTGPGLRGLGLAATVHVTGVGPLIAEARIEIDRRGRIILFSASADSGTGQRTILAQIAAHELSVPAESIDVRLGELQNAPQDPGLGASKGSYISSNAVGAAAAGMVEKLRGIAAQKFGINDPILHGGTIRSGSATLSLGELVAASDEANDGVLTATGRFTGGRDYGAADPSDGYSCIGQAVEVEVDPDLGTVRVLRVASVHDSGTILNPTLARGQVEGGIVMALGMALGEEFLRDDGRVVNVGFADYLVPRAGDMPEMTVEFIRSAVGAGRYGSLGVAEGCLAGIPAAIANAIHDAIGLRLRDLPVTPDKIVMGLQDADSPAPVALWKRPGRWRSELVRRAYPLGLKAALRRLTPEPAAIGAEPEIHAARSLDEAIARLAEGPVAKVAAAGSDLLLQRRQGLLGGVGKIVTLAGIAELQGIRRDTEGRIVIGSSTRLAEIAASDTIPDTLGLKQTAGTIASAQLRETATLGGNLGQAKRCWYYRNGFACYKRAGATAPCYAVSGEHKYFHAVTGAGRCHAVTPSDLATTLVALDAQAEVYSQRGRRSLDMAHLYSGPGELALTADEVLASVVIPQGKDQWSTAFCKFSLYDGGFAVCSAAVSLLLDAHGAVSDLRLVLGGVAPEPLIVSDCARLLVGRRITPALARKASEGWIAAAHPLQGNRWKLTAATALLGRTLLDAQRSAAERKGS